MKGLVTKVSGRMPSMSMPHKVMSASNLKGQGAKATSSKSSIAGCFTASRKKGSVKGSI